MSDQWKIGNEFAPFHPDASHVEPGYRDGWNACYKMSADEIERLRAENAALSGEVRRRRQYVQGYDERYTKLEADNDRLRAALVAAMEIVQRERTRIAYNAKGAPPAVEIGYADILRRLDAVIAQADAALGTER